MGVEETGSSGFKKKHQSNHRNKMSNHSPLAPLVSVCVQTYNHERYIEACLEGILMQQTTFPFEIILGEDESSDGTREICKAYAQKHPDKIKLFLRSRKDVIFINGRPTGRYNFIENLKASTGKYIALCEGDDYWTDPLKLQKQIEFLEPNRDYVGVFHNTGFIDERKEGTEIIPWRTFAREIFEAKDTIRHLSLFHTSSYCFRNMEYDYSLLNNSNIISGDMLLLGIISKYGKFKLLNEIMSVYRKNQGGITSGESLRNYHKSRIVLNKTLNAYFEFKYDKMAKSVIKFHKDELLKLRYPKLFKLRKLINKRI